jgi:hypothetical protein
MYCIFRTGAWNVNVTSTYELCVCLCGPLTVTEARRGRVNESNCRELHSIRKAHSRVPPRLRILVTWTKVEAAGSCIYFLHQSSPHKAQTFWKWIFIFDSFIGIVSSSDYKASISWIINELERIMRWWHSLISVLSRNLCGRLKIVTENLSEGTWSSDRDL